MNWSWTDIDLFDMRLNYTIQLFSRGPVFHPIYADQRTSYKTYQIQALFSHTTSPLLLHVGPSSIEHLLLSHWYDFTKTFSAYSLKRDSQTNTLLQRNAEKATEWWKPWYGLKQIAQGIAGVVASVLIFPCSIGADLVDSNDPLHLLYNLITTPLLLAARLIHSAVSIASGIINFITTPLTYFIQKPLRSFITLCKDYIVSHRNIEDSISVQALVKEADKELKQRTPNQQTLANIIVALGEKYTYKGITLDRPTKIGFQIEKQAYTNAIQTQIVGPPMLMFSPGSQQHSLTNLTHADAYIALYRRP